MSVRLQMTALFATLLAAQICQATEPLRSGLQVGETLTAVFEPLNVNGEQAGELHCLVCENGLSPVAMVFAREASEPLVRLIVQLDAATAKHRDAEMGSFVVFLGEQEKLEEQLKAIAKKHQLKHTILSIFDATGPEGFNVAKEADVTVVLYRKHSVKANHAFKRGELTDKKAEKVLSDLPKILEAR